MNSSAAAGGAVGSAYGSPTFAKTASWQLSHEVSAASISPSGRDVVLAGHNGLNILDLDDPYAEPAHFEHKTSANVAEIQWNHHESHQSCIASTDGIVTHIWDVNAGHQSIIKTLKGHARSVTDMCWSISDPSVLATCAIDTNVLLWDLRASSSPQAKASAWTMGATQVKFNKRIQYQLASAHDSSLFIWDTRKLISPLKTFKAHDTKIYGIDWSNEHASSIMSCSMDRSIKLWDVDRNTDDPHHADPLNRIIRTQYPVWRARYTPFGNGILAMPHSADNRLHLYDRRTYRIADRDAAPRPVERFSGHEKPVQEFLWRVRGTIQDGRDYRDFQLVSWGADKKLCLHSISADVLARIDWAKGDRFQDELGREQGNDDVVFPHNRVVYKTFRTENAGGFRGRFTFPDELAQRASVYTRMPPMQEALGGDEDSSGEDEEQLTHFLKQRPQPARRLDVGKGDQEAVAWLKGVKMSRPEDAQDRRAHGSSASPDFFGTDSLGDEISYVADKHEDISITEVSVRGRKLNLSVDGPWAMTTENTTENHKLHLSIDFPGDYPHISPPIFSLEKTTQLDFKYTFIVNGLKTISRAHARVHKGCLDAIVLYLKGARSIAESVNIPSDSRELPILGLDGTDERPQSSPSLDLTNWSDDDDDVALGTLSKSEELDGSTADLAEAKNSNVPLPTTCGARFSASGKLVCFFSSDKATKRRSAAEQTVDYTGVGESLQAFKELIRTKTRPHADSDSTGSDSSLSLTMSTSMLASKPRASEHNPRISYRSGKWPSYYHLKSDWVYDQPGEDGDANNVPASEVAIYASLDDLLPVLPVNKTLAEEYTLYGSAAEICKHNREVCEKHGFYELAHIWGLAAQIVADVVPLELTLHNDEPLVTMATRASVLVTKRDATGHASRQLKFDEPKSVKQPYSLGRIKWGNHPFGSKLVKKLLDDFEKKHDIQMLAMLSCVFAIKPKEYQPPPPPPLVSDSEPDSDDDLPPHRFPQPKTPAQDPIITFKNQDKFDDSNHAHTPLLTPDDVARHRAWRLHYGEHLLSWDLHVSRAAVLNFNELVPQGMEAEDATATHKPEGIRCVICYTILDTLAMSCLDCGCEAHDSCVRMWTVTNDSGETVNDACPNGCLT